jgi:membrane-bound serine protease (ClpP class)
MEALMEHSGMREVFRCLCACLVAFVLASGLDAGGAARGSGTAPPSAGGIVYLLTLADAVGPVTARYLTTGIERAERADARAVVIEIDTPGGLDTSMRQIVKAILAARIPVITYVAPSGARAASAGVFITLAAPVAAMAPGTNIGAASPVTIGGPISADSTMKSKITNDAAAYARSLAERYGRNATWAEAAVRKAVSLPAEEAVRDSVVDLMAGSLDELLRLVDGRRVQTAAGPVVLETRGAEVRALGMNWRDRLLALITNPSIAYLLFLAGILGIALELYHPGAILPGVVGGISLILAFFAFQTLPVSAAGVLLILLAVVLFIVEVKVPSYGILSIGGVISLVLGSLFLFEPGSSLRVSLSVIFPAVATFAAFFLFVAYMAARAHRRPVQSGVEGMIGEIGEARTALDPDGKVFVHGEYWNARSSTPVRRGARVRVLKVEGLKLEVEPADAGMDSPSGRS